LFNDFIAAKRKNKILTEKGSLTKKIKDEIESKIKEILDPILEERRKNELKEQDLQKFALDMQKININALFVEELEKAKEQLQYVLKTVDIRYPNATAEAQMQINANIKVVEANIKTLQAEAQKRELEEVEAKRIAEEKAKQEEIEQRAKTIQEAQKTEDKNEVKEAPKEVVKTKYQLPLEELEVLSAMKFEANSESEAKEKIINMFKQQLDMIELNKIEG
jgi:hypothetical protein